MKKLNLFVGVLVIAALLLLIVLLVQTFFTDGNTARPDPTTTPPKATATITPPTTDDAVDTPEPTDDVSPTPDIAPLEGASLTLEAFIGREKLSFIYSSAMFDRIQMDTGELFYLKSDPTNDTFIEIVFHEGDIEFRKASFLDPFIPRPTSLDMLGQILVAGSGVTAEGMATTDGVSFVDAWLIDVEGGFFAVVAGYKDDAAKADIYRMLDTLTFSL